MSTSDQRRLLVEAATLDAGEAAVAGPEHHYLFRVLRLAVGDALVVFDGAGREADAVVASVTATNANLRLGPPRSPPRPGRPELTVLLALIKGDRTEWAIQKLVELGADHICPVRAARSVVVLHGAKAAARSERYAAVARAAAQQSRRASMPTVAPIADLQAALAATPTDAVRLVCHAGGAGLGAVLAGAAPARVAVLIGPEGGLTAAEVADAEAAGFSAVGLGPRTLRAETAAIAVASVLGYAWGDLKGD